MTIKRKIVIWHTIPKSYVPVSILEILDQQLTEIRPFPIGNKWRSEYYNIKEKVHSILRNKVSYVQQKKFACDLKHFPHHPKKKIKRIPHFTVSTVPKS